MIDKSLLRELVKSVIAEEVAAIRKPSTNAAPPLSEERVTIASDADLVAFARRVLSLASDPAKAKEIAAGRYPFRLARPATQPAATPALQATAPVAQSHRIDSGVVTESSLNKLPRGLSRLVLGPGVTVTPLAKDRARSLGLTFERMKP
ncbi:hypothetical protein [Dongia deserti]|uniref:hypothetical protein n=1 Tax=Dongia deserti TaxID=2268030 RepID=UPI000E655E65|nr:hypothetical protein [Dongia deserti]